MLNLENHRLIVVEVMIMMRPDTKVKKVFLYPKPVDFRKSIDGLSALVELEMTVSLFEPDKA